MSISLKKIKYRELEDRDYSELFKNWVEETYTGTTARFYTRDQYFAKVFDDLRALFQQKIKFLVAAEYEGDLIGAIICTGVDVPVRIGIGSVLWVASKYRKQGVGTTLCNMAVEWAEGQQFNNKIVEIPSRNFPMKHILRKKLKFKESRTTWVLCNERTS